MLRSGFALSAARLVAGQGAGAVFATPHTLALGNTTVTPYEELDRKLGKKKAI